MAFQSSLPFSRPCTAEALPDCGGARASSATSSCSNYSCNNGGSNSSSISFSHQTRGLRAAAGPTGSLPAYSARSHTAYNANIFGSHLHWHSTAALPGSSPCTGTALRAPAWEAPHAATLQPFFNPEREGSGRRRRRCTPALPEFTGSLSLAEHEEDEETSVEELAGAALAQAAAAAAAATAAATSASSASAAVPGAAHAAASTSERAPASAESSPSPAVGTPLATNGVATFKASSRHAPKEQLQYPACPKWRRVLLKVSGEALAGDGTSNIDPKVTAAIAQEVALITRLGVEVAIVVGGGNFFRGATWEGASGLDRASADHIGMMATVMNAIFLQGSLESVGVPTRVQTAFRMCEVAEPYIRRRAIRHLEKGRVVIFAAGTGNPFFTTDTAAALRAAEIDAEVVLKGTNVDGVYDSDPKKNADARLLKNLSLREVTVQNLRVMDITAATLCAENKIPVVVFNLSTPGNITRALSGEPVGTVVTP